MASALRDRLRLPAAVMRYRRWIAVTLAGVVGLVNRGTPLDLPAFATLGQQILSGRLAGVYASDFTQAGPLQLVISRLLLAGGRDGIPPPPTRALVDVTLVLGAMALCGRQPLREVMVAVVTLLWLLGPVPWNGHPGEVAVAALWAYAMVLHRRDLELLAASALAVAVLIAPWAVLGFPCLLAVGPPARALRIASVAAGLAALGYLPFVLTGHFAMFEHVWGAVPGSLPYLLGLRDLGWPARAMQGIVVAGGCGLVAYRCRGRRTAPAAAPLAAALLRVATDPLTFVYFWLPVAVATVLLVALIPDGERWWRQAFAAALAYLAVIAATTATAAAGALTCLVALVAAGRCGLFRDPSPKSVEPASSTPIH